MFGSFSAFLITLFKFHIFYAGSREPEMHLRKEPLISIAIIFAVVATVVVVERLERPSRYASGIIRHRSETDEFMRHSVESPFTGAMKEDFNGLSYFPPDPDYRVTAKLVAVEAKTTLSVPTSTGAQREYTPHTYAEFTLNGGQHRLLLLKAEGDRSSNRLFLAFSDSGHETYAGGRYIDLYLQKDDEIVIDFNLAYNPYCVYNETYSCPLPPPGNHLSIPMPAGEKLYPYPLG